MVFIDKKVFTVATLMNAQNDRVCAPRLKKKHAVSPARFPWTRSTFSVGLIAVACLNAKCGQFLFLKTVCDHCLNKVMILLIY
jgi:hypothetical protein